MNRLLTFFFRLLYTHLAFCYDLVAWTVSMGKWDSWVQSAQFFITGSRILEIGHGPGHLLYKLGADHKSVFGMDASRQMGRIAYRRLKALKSQPGLTRGRAQFLPFAAHCLDSVVCTFPTLYIFQEAALNEIYRILSPTGRLVVVLSAWITETHWLGRLLYALFKVSGQALPEQINADTLFPPFTAAGFVPELHWIYLPGSRVLLLVADKPAPA